MRLASLSLFVVIAGSGCAGSRWSVVDSRPLLAVTVAPAELQGPVDRMLVAQRRATMIGELRARGYQVLDHAVAGVPTLTMKIEGTLIEDSQLHAPDDPRHHIINDLHYQFIAYKVHLDVVDSGGHVVVCGSASSNQDPAGAVAELTAHLVRDVPAAAATFAAR
ncbi:MAG: hypothetical protein JWM53_2055 [bacterium]|nr:hypothetical protein [bacterium]